MQDCRCPRLPILGCFSSRQIRASLSNFWWSTAAAAAVHRNLPQTRTLLQETACLTVCTCSNCVICISAVMTMTRWPWYKNMTCLFWSLCQNLTSYVKVYCLRENCTNTHSAISKLKTLGLHVRSNDNVKAVKYKTGKHLRSVMV